MLARPMLAQHLMQQELQMPSRWVLIRARSELDYAAMIYSRRCILNPESADWYVHLRADSSPQGGRDWFVVELDYCHGLASKSTAERHSLLHMLEQGGSIVSRILPLTILGKKAGTTVHKAQRLIHALTLESGDIQETLDRTMSYLSDFGAESGLYTMPNPNGPATDDAGFLMKRALPIADADHALHHIMGEIDVLDSWQEFKDTLNAVARTFSSYYKLDRFRALQLLIVEHSPYSRPAQASAAARAFQQCPYSQDCGNNQARPRTSPVYPGVTSLLSSERTNQQIPVQYATPIIAAYSRPVEKASATPAAPDPGLPSHSSECIRISKRVPIQLLSLKLFLSAEDVCVRHNPAIPDEHRGTFDKLFKTICPSFVEHRWNYLFETLDWLLPRKQALEYMKLQDLGEQGDKELTARELELLGNITQHKDSLEALRFWATAELAKQLANWGHRVSGVLHGCPCHPERRGRRRLDDGQDPPPICSMAGRMGVPLANGIVYMLLGKLTDLVLSQSSQAAVTKMETHFPAETQSLLNSFTTARAKIRLRTEQVFSYWGELPWSMLSIMRPFVEVFENPQEVMQSSMCFSGLKIVVLCRDCRVEQ